MAEDNLSHLPIELYLHILSFLLPSNLASLIRVSKIYQNATKHELYRNIELSSSIDQANGCIRTLSNALNSPAGLVQRFTLRFPEDEYKDEDKRRMRDQLFWGHLGSALGHMNNVQDIDLECPHHFGVWTALLSQPKDHLKSLTLIHTENYSPRSVAEAERFCRIPPPLPCFESRVRFPSLICLEIQVGFRVDSIHQGFIRSLLITHAEQLQAVSIATQDMRRSETMRLLPRNIKLPRVSILADLDPAYLQPLLSDQLPNLRTLTFAPIPSTTLTITSEELVGHFEKLQTIEASYSVLQLFLSSPRSLEQIEMQTGIETKWEDVRTTVKMLSNCSQSLRVLHIDLFLLGAKIKELWSSIPPLPHLETLLIRTAPDWSNFDLREALNSLIWASKILFPKLPKLQSFFFMEGCPNFPLSSFDDFATHKVQKHVLDHWEKDKVPASLREVIFTSQLTWKKVGKSWQGHTAASGA
ncbi:hypothetical protein QCA50_014212 [Cerrena zonata]|uniref:F-box domain-containing protein n=1 Tax=Cerrena zonata TaxID=2478898 RepID=A0AAW0FP75_9APHY